MWLSFASILFCFFSFHYGKTQDCAITQWELLYYFVELEAILIYELQLKDSWNYN